MLITCFNLAGGYAIAASIISHASNEKLTFQQSSQNQQILKKSTVDIQLVQVNKEDSENDELLFPDLSHSINQQVNSYIPDFKLLNKHFLLHYGTSIKDKERPAYVLHQNFRL